MYVSPWTYIRPLDEKSPEARKDDEHSVRCFSLPLPRHDGNTTRLFLLPLLLP